MRFLFTVDYDPEGKTFGLSYVTPTIPMGSVSLRTSWLRDLLMQIGDCIVDEVHDGVPGEDNYLL